MGRPVLSKTNPPRGARLTAGGLIVAGGALLVASLLSESLLPRSWFWSPEQSAQLARLDEELDELHRQFFIVLRRQDLPHSTPRPLGLRIKAKNVAELRGEYKAALARPAEIAAWLRWSGIALLAGSVVVYAVSAYAVSRTKSQLSSGTTGDES